MFNVITRALRRNCFHTGLYLREVEAFTGSIYNNTTINTLFIHFANTTAMSSSSSNPHQQLHDKSGAGQHPNTGVSGADKQHDHGKTGADKHHDQDKTGADKHKDHDKNDDEKSSSLKEKIQDKVHDVADLGKKLVTGITGKKEGGKEESGDATASDHKGHSGATASTTKQPATDVNQATTKGHKA